MFHVKVKSELCINRGGVFLIPHTHSLEDSALVEERSAIVEEEIMSQGFIFVYCWSSILRKLCWVFYPMRVSQDKSLSLVFMLCLLFLQWSCICYYCEMECNAAILCLSILNINMVSELTWRKARYGTYDTCFTYDNLKVRVLYSKNQSSWNFHHKSILAKFQNLKPLQVVDNISRYLVSKGYPHIRCTL